MENKTTIKCWVTTSLSVKENEDFTEIMDDSLYQQNELEAVNKYSVVR